MIAMGLLILGGVVCVLAALFLTLLAVDMLQHPGGIGVEKVLAPIVGLIALGLFTMAGFCMYWASRLGKGSTGEKELRLRSAQAMEKQTSPQELMGRTSAQLNRLNPKEIKRFRTNVLQQFGLPPLSTIHNLAREAVIFTLIGGLLAAIATLSLMAGLVYGSVVGVGIWVVYRLFRFALT